MLPHTETLTSRERVIRTLNHQPVDRFPIDLGSNMATGISAFAYWNLRRSLGLSTSDIWVPDLVQMLAYVDDDILERFHLDCILLEPRWPGARRWNPRGEYQFSVAESFQPEKNVEGDWIARQGGLSMRMPANGYYFDGDWLSDWGELDEDDAIELYGREAERIYKETPYATNFVGYSYGGGFGAFFGGIEHSIEMIEEPERVLAEHQAKLQVYLRRAGKILDRFGPYIQMITIADDMGGQDRPLCRPSLIERFSVPFIKHFADFIHRNSDVKVFMHSCGSIQPLLPMLIDAGIDAINPVQVSAANMDPRTLKERFGSQLVFWGGGCDTKNVLTAGSPHDVRASARELASILAPGGGFVFNQVHNILGEVPPENVIAMLDEAYTASWACSYPQAPAPS